MTSVINFRLLESDPKACSSFRSTFPLLPPGLARSHAKAVQIEPVYIIKQGELDQLVQLVSKYSLEPALGDPDQVMEGMLANMTEVVTLSNQLTACTVVIQHLEETLGGKFELLTLGVMVWRRT